jgi:hypothetical protein
MDNLRHIDRFGLAIEINFTARFDKGWGSWFSYSGGMGRDYFWPHGTVTLFGITLRT